MPAMRLTASIALCFGCHLALAQALAQTLPPAVDAALARAKVPRDSVAMLVVDADGGIGGIGGGGGGGAPRLAWRADVPMNPASVMKLVTTYAALDRLGPAYTWRTPVYVDGQIEGDVLKGNLYIQGQGDPKLVIERMWLLLRRVQALGIHTVSGDIVIDNSAFAAMRESDPGAFDGEPLRPYNAAPDALLLNFKSVVMTFTPTPDGRAARIDYAPPMAAVATQAQVPTSTGGCGDWHAALGADFSDSNQIRFAGALPAACGEKTWAVAYADPRTYALRAIGGMWAEMGGRVGGQMKSGKVPAGLQPAFSFESPPLADVVRDINKFSNNVMAQQVFLTLGMQRGQPATREAARGVVRRWWEERVAGTVATTSAKTVADTVANKPAPPVLDNGSGLSRDARVSAAALAQMLQSAWRSAVMPELMASLPSFGVDGTLKKRSLASGAAAHLKTGSLRDVAAIAGYVDGANGKRWVLVAIANGANAGAARPAFDALIDWAAQDR